MTAPPISDGAVLVGADGRIVAVGPDPVVPRSDGVEQVVLPGAVLLPGLVNAHTHLELTGLEGQVEDDDFVAWIATLRARKAERNAAEFLAAARQGIRDCWAAGVTTIADTGDTGAVIQALCELGGSGICYQEVFGPHPDQCADSMAFLAERVASLRALAGGRVSLGVSPHAPYSVSAPLYQAVAAFAATEGLPLAVHLAESEAESALLVAGTGGFAAMWRTRGIPLPTARCRSPIDWLDALGVLSPRLLAIHVVHADAQDIATLAARGVAVAHCPLSNHRHGHGDAPIGALVRGGVRVGVGTDSVASVGRLDLLAEARAARILGWLDAEEAVALVTREAARALGLDEEIGTLTPGRWGDLTAIGLRDPAPSDLHEAVLASGVGDVLGTWVGGREVFRAAARPLSFPGDSLPGGA